MCPRFLARQAGHSWYLARSNDSLCLVCSFPTFDGRYDKAIRATPGLPTIPARLIAFAVAAIVEIKKEFVRTVSD
jgi:hypothetical protein